MLFRVALLLVVLQVVTPQPTVLKLKNKVVGAVGDVVKDGITTIQDVTTSLEMKEAQFQDKVQKKVLKTTFKVLALLDAKIEFILCTFFRICKNTNFLDQINREILQEATEEVVGTTDEPMFSEEDADRYIHRRVVAVLCKYRISGEKFCFTPVQFNPAYLDIKYDQPEEGIAEPMDDEQQGTKARGSLKATKANLVKKAEYVKMLFQRLSLKVGQSLCTLKVWCPPAGGQEEAAGALPTES